MSTIAAIGTAIGNSGISIIRISGKDSLSIIKNIFTNANKLKPNTILYGNIIQQGELVDNALVSYFKQPFSFTGEDVCEINCHGGTYITQKVLDIVLKQGAKLAEPGEFTKRAFLNGKIDLSKAESIVDMIQAKTNLEARIATQKLEGSLFRQIDELRNNMVEVLAHIEVNIDYPEYDYEQIERQSLLEKLEDQIEKIKKLYNSYEQGKYIKNGIKVGIFGLPNVGKSSLLNCLSNSDKAIVTDIPGTTRDMVEETISMGNMIIHLCDTAGIRDTKDVIEKIGVEKSIKKLEDIDLAIYLFDVENNLTDQDESMLSKIKNKNIKTIYVINKMDKIKKLKYDRFMGVLNRLGILETIDVSILQNTGIEKLRQSIEKLFLSDQINSTNENIIVSERQRDLLYQSYQLLEQSKEEIEKNIPIDIAFIKIKQSTDKLGDIIGYNISEDVVHKIFEKFCLGK